MHYPLWQSRSARSYNNPAFVPKRDILDSSTTLPFTSESVVLGSKLQSSQSSELSSFFQSTLASTLPAPSTIEEIFTPTYPSQTYSTPLAGSTLSEPAGSTLQTHTSYAVPEIPPFPPPPPPLEVPPPDSMSRTVTPDVGLIVGAALAACIAAIILGVGTALYRRHRARVSALSVPQCSGDSVMSTPSLTADLLLCRNDLCPHALPKTDTTPEQSSAHPSRLEAQRNDSTLSLLNPLLQHSRDSDSPSQTEKSMDASYLEGCGIRSAELSAGPLALSDRISMSTTSTAPPFNPGVSSGAAISNPMGRQIAGRPEHPTGYPGRYGGQSEAHNRHEPEHRSQMRYSDSTLGVQPEVFYYEVDGGVRLAGGPPGWMAGGSTSTGNRGPLVATLPPPYSPEYY
ncbi:hypothetical protein C8Q80DRAFT_1117848 [Daedaleopsis nitida]|nr:hypothetical protein C8Q80DRAFT_1117848 [Daedaleopsis nitida]